MTARRCDLAIKESWFSLLLLFKKDEARRDVVFLTQRGEGVGHKSKIKIRIKIVRRGNASPEH